MEDILQTSSGFAERTFTRECCANINLYMYIQKPQIQVIWVFASLYLRKNALPNSYVLIIMAQAGTTFIILGTRPIKIKEFLTNICNINDINMASNNFI